jgi:hypothetical protein
MVVSNLSTRMRSGAAPSADAGDVLPWGDDYVVQLLSALATSSGAWRSEATRRWKDRNPTADPHRASGRRAPRDVFSRCAAD